MDFYKVCTRCRDSFPEDTRHFYRDKRNRSDGLRSECKQCSKKLNRKQYSQNKAYWKQYYEENREHMLSYANLVYANKNVS